MPSSGGDLDEALHFQFRDQLSTPLRRSLSMAAAEFKVPANRLMAVRR
jgi:hypothetical protein